MSSFVWHAALKDLRRRRRDPWSVIMWVAVPLLIGSLITSLSSGGATPTAILLLDDRDASVLSGAIATAFAQGGLSDLVQVTNVSAEEGLARIRDGEGSALLTIPDGFGASVLAREPTQLELLTNPSQQILPGIISQVLEILVDGVFYAQRLFGEELDQIGALVDNGGQPVTNAGIANLSVAINEKIQAIAPLAFPPALALTAVADDPGDGQAVSIGFLFFPSILFMALLFTSRGLTDDLWREREQGTLRRLGASPQGLPSFLAAKVVAAAVFLAAVSTVLLTIGFLYHDVPWSRMPVALVWMVLSGLTLYAIMSLIQLYAPSRQAGSLMSTLVMFPLMLIGGSFFPFEAMPDWFAAIGRWTPNGVMLEQLKNYLLGRHDLASMASAFAGAVMATAVLLALAGLRNRSFARA